MSTVHLLAQKVILDFRAYLTTRINNCLTVSYPPLDPSVMSRLPPSLSLRFIREVSLPDKRLNQVSAAVAWSPGSAPIHWQAQEC